MRSSVEKNQAGQFVDERILGCSMPQMGINAEEEEALKFHGNVDFSHTSISFAIAGSGSRFTFDELFKSESASI